MLFAGVPRIMQSPYPAQIVQNKDFLVHQHSDALHLIERSRRGPDRIDYILRPLKIVPGLPELIEYNCDENNRDLQHLISAKPGVIPPPTTFR